jgi:hypothetical protein
MATTKLQNIFDRDSFFSACPTSFCGSNITDALLFTMLVEKMGNQASSLYFHVYHSFSLSLSLSLPLPRTQRTVDAMNAVLAAQQQAERDILRTRAALDTVTPPRHALGTSRGWVGADARVNHGHPNERANIA